MNITIITEADSTIGIGHLSRTIAISKELICKGYKVTFLSHSELAQKILKEVKLLNFKKINDKKSIIDHLKTYCKICHYRCLAS